MNTLHEPHEPSEHLAQRVLDRIVTEKVSPRPRWEFLLKNYSFWTFGVLAVALGAVAFSAALFEVENAGWSLYAATHTDLVQFFLDVVPFLWVAALAAFILVGYANIRHTRRGYRYSLALIALGAVLTSVTLGTGLYAAGFGGEIEEAIGNHPPFYRPILSEERSWWLAPNKGLLGGIILSVEPAASSSQLTILLKDFSGHLWRIDGTDLRRADLSALAHGGIVRVVGVPIVTSATTTSDFHACFIFPWEVFNVVTTPPLPRTLAFIASTSERIAGTARSELCRGIRPYKQLHTLDKNGL